MVVWQNAEEPEWIFLAVARVEYYDFVSACVVVVLIESQQLIDTYVREHAANAIDENKRPSEIILDVDMVEDSLVQEL